MNSLRNILCRRCAGEEWITQNVGVHDHIEQTVTLPLNIQYLRTMDHNYTDHTVGFQNIVGETNILLNRRHEDIHLFHNVESLTYVLQTNRFWELSFRSQQDGDSAIHTVALQKHFPTSEKNTTNGSSESNNSATSVSQTSWNSFSVDTMLVNVFRSWNFCDDHFSSVDVEVNEILTWL